MKKQLLIAGASLGLLQAFPVFADATTTFQVQAEVLKVCHIEADDLDFGSYTPGEGELTGNTDLTVRCSKGTDFEVSLSGGASNDVTDRQMSNGDDVLEYNLYTDAALNNVWGDTPGDLPTGTGDGLGSGNEVTLTVYGELPDTDNNQNASEGAYTDTITATVLF